MIQSECVVLAQTFRAIRAVQPARVTPPERMTVAKTFRSERHIPSRYIAFRDHDDLNKSLFKNGIIQ